MSTHPLPELVSGVTFPPEYDGLHLVETAPRAHPSRSMVTISRPDRRVWREALRLAEGDVSRLRTQPDGSVIVANRSRAGRPAGSRRPGP